jgi:hypothetical protein
MAGLDLARDKLYGGPARTQELSPGPGRGTFRQTVASGRVTGRRWSGHCLPGW